MSRVARAFEQSVRQMIGERQWKTLPPSEKKTIRDLGAIQHKFTKEIEKRDKGITNH